VSTDAPDLDRLALEVVQLLRAHGSTVAVAESLTGGLLGAALTSVPGASAVFRGGVLSYATDLKASLLGVDPALLERRGAVDPDVAAAMASGVRRVCAASYGLGTTGVAGPDPQDGRLPGTVHVAVAWEGGVSVVSPACRGSRDEIRRQTVEAALRLLRERSRESGG
jgi:nicotinamide-nucleotide amidase